MNHEEVREKIIGILKSHSIDVSKIKSDTKMSEDLNIDSLDLVEIVMEIEEIFSITILETEMVNLKTFGDMNSFVVNKLSEATK